jgi:DNA-binding response OmpR family regulator
MAYRFDRVTILVVDDNPHMRALVCAVLQAFDIKAIYEADGADAAWASLKTNPCDVVMLDWVMSGTSGLDLIKRIRTAEDSPNPFVPIMMLTGHSSADHVRQARDAGANEFLAKPVSAKAIATHLLSIIEHPRPFIRAGLYFGPCRRRRRDPDYQGPERRSNANAVDVDSPQRAPAA